MKTTFDDDRHECCCWWNECGEWWDEWQEDRQWTKEMKEMNAFFEGEQGNRRTRRDPCGTLLLAIVTISLWATVGQGGDACCAQDLSQWLLLSAIVGFSIQGLVWFMMCCASCCDTSFPMVSNVVSLGTGGWFIAWLVIGVQRHDKTRPCADACVALLNVSLTSDCCDEDL